MSFGLSDRDILKIQTALGSGALERVQENPYILSRLFPLKVVDAVADRLGVDKRGNIHRGIAIAEYELDKHLNDGHCYVHTHTLLAKARVDCKLKPEQFDEGTLAEHETIVVDGPRSQLTAIADAESLIADRVRALLTCEIASGVTAAGTGLDPDQQNAVVQMLYAGISVVTGAPGTGKTTCTKAVLEEFDLAHVSYALCAPTGKAARRFSEVTGRQASTIHRLLRWGPFGFEYNADYRLPYDVVLVDETSMVDIRLAADLLSAIDPERTRIVFIGDVNQLPPVGPGAFLADLIASKTVPVVELKTLHRAALGSWIYRNAPKILDGAGVELDGDYPDFDWYEMRTDSAAQIKDVAVQVVQNQLEQDPNWDAFQLIVPMKVRTGGAIELNGALRQALLKESGLAAPIGWPEDGFKVCKGDRVIQCRNNYDLGVFNGECGEVALVESPSNICVAFAEGDRRRFVQYKGIGALRDLAPSYALTVHRVQGSEWPTIIVVCHSEHGRMLNRRLFYTAVTRARKKVIIIGDERGVKQAIASKQDMHRRTMLATLIAGGA